MAGVGPVAMATTGGGGGGGSGGGDPGLATGVGAGENDLPYPAFPPLGTGGTGGGGQMNPLSPPTVQSSGPIGFNPDLAYPIAETITTQPPSSPPTVYPPTSSDQPTGYPLQPLNTEELAFPPMVVPPQPAADYQGYPPASNPPTPVGFAGNHVHVRVLYC